MFCHTHCAGEFIILREGSLGEMLVLVLFKQNLSFEAGQKGKGFVDIRQQIFNSKLSEGASCQHPTPFLRQQAQHEELGGWREKNGRMKL